VSNNPAASRIARCRRARPSAEQSMSRSRTTLAGRRAVCQSGHHSRPAGSDELGTQWLRRIRSSETSRLLLVGIGGRQISHWQS